MSNQTEPVPGASAVFDSDAPEIQSWKRSQTPAQQQRLRLLRFGAASATYAVGLLILGVFALLGKLPWPRLWGIAAGFVIVNLTFLALFVTRANLRFKDPSLTMAQVLAASGSVPLILLSSPYLDPVAVPFYSVLFVFAMLRLDREALFKVGAFILASYALAVRLRLRWYRSVIPPSTEAITALLVVVSTLWFGSAASYIGRLRRRLKETAATLEQLATRDSLTGLWNRRQIEALLSRETRRAERSGQPLTILLVDVDHFKAINDRFGHATGDKALCQVAGIIRSTVRVGAEVGRWGGEEFLIILPETPLGEALECAQRVREKLETTHLEIGQQLTVTASIGLAVWSRPESFPELLSRADRAMYHAKSSGRNRVGII